MRRLAVTLGCTVAVAVGSPVAAADEPGLDGRTFDSIAVDGAPIPGGGPLVVGFERGRISADAGCNHAFGPVDPADGVLVVGHLGMTMMACPPPADGADAWLTELFDARPHWTLAGDTLTLRTATATVTLRARQTGPDDGPEPAPR